MKLYPLVQGEVEAVQAVQSPCNVLLVVCNVGGRVGVDADALQSPEFAPYLTAINFDPTRVVEVDLEESQALSLAKALKESDFQAWKASVLAGGYDTGLGFCLPVEEEYRQLSTSYKVFADAALAAGLRDSETPMTAYDMEGGRHDLSTADYMAMLLGYGQYAERRYHEERAIRAALDEAATVAEVNAITMPA